MNTNDLEMAGLRIGHDCSIVLVTGEQRSGTTLMADLLDAQPSVTCQSDFAHVSRVVRLVGSPSMTEALDVKDRIAILEAVTSESLRAHQFCHPWSVQDFNSILDWYLASLERVRRSDDVIVGHKSTRCYDVLGELFRRLPQFRVVFMLRDPRAVAASELIRQKRSTRDDVLKWWCEGIDAWRRVESSPFADRAMMVRYEDLVLDPAHQLPALAAFLGIPSVEVASPGAQGRLGGNSSFTNDLTGLDPRPATRWRQGSGVGLALTEGVTARMADFGYA